MENSKYLEVNQLIDELANTEEINRKIASIAPIPIPDEPKQKEFPLAALGELVPFVIRLHEVIQAPMPMCAQAVLAAANLAVQGHLNVKMGSIRAPISLYFLTVAISGERKSALDAIVLKPHRSFQRQMYRPYQRQLEEYSAKQKAYENKIRKNDIVLPGDKPRKPILPNVIVNDFTVEGLHRSLNHAYPSQGAFVAEGGVFTGGYGMKSENAIKTIACLSSLWDGHPMNKTRAEAESIYLEGKRFCLHVMIQPDVGREFLLNSQFHGQGIHARILLICPQTTVGDRVFKRVDIEQSEEFQKYSDRIQEIYKHPYLYLEDSDHEIGPREVELDEEAQLRWIEFYNYIEQNLKFEGKYYEVREFASKAPEMALRVAGTIAAFKNLEVESISRQQIESAISLIEFYLDEKMRFQNVRGENEFYKRAARLMDFLINKNKDEISSQEIMQYGPPYVRSREGLNKMMAFLEEHHWVEAGSFSIRTKAVKTWKILTRRPQQ